MRRVGTVDTQLEAEAFVAGMSKLDLKVVADKGIERWELWAVDEDRVAEARVKLPEFLEANASEQQLKAFVKKAQPAPAATAPAAERTPAAALAERFRSLKGMDRGKAMRHIKGMTWFNVAPVTIIMIVLCLLVAMASNFGNSKQVVNALIMGPGGAYKEVFASGHLWRLLTPIFVHFGFVHLLLNIWWLRDLGPMLERSIGTLKLLAMVLVIAVCSNLVENVLADPRTIAGGMSGVVFGLCAYTWVRGRLDLTSGVYVANQTAAIMGIFFLLCWAGLFGNIANVTHTAGLLIGLGWGYIDAQRVVRR